MQLSTVLERLWRWFCLALLCLNIGLILFTLIKASNRCFSPFPSFEYGLYLSILIWWDLIPYFFILFELINLFLDDGFNLLEAVFSTDRCINMLIRLVAFNWVTVFKKTSNLLILSLKNRLGCPEILGFSLIIIEFITRWRSILNILWLSNHRFQSL